MKNYVRYIILLILIIAFGLLCISIFNKVTEPDVSKINNKNKTEEKVEDQEEIGGPEVITPSPTPTPSEEPEPTIPEHPVPDTAVGDKNKTEIPEENVPIYSQYKGNLIIIEEQR